ncbi:MAG: DUF4287 domain-containing protein [Jatrophihabitans sp.]
MTTPTGRARISFPAIEKRYGKPISCWMELIATSQLEGYMQLVNWLKTEYGVGYGHAMGQLSQGLAAQLPADAPRVR